MGRPLHSTTCSTSLGGVSITRQLAACLQVRVPVWAERTCETVRPASSTTFIARLATAGRHGHFPFDMEPIAFFETRGACTKIRFNARRLGLKVKTLQPPRKASQPVNGGGRTGKPISPLKQKRSSTDRNRIVNWNKDIMPLAPVRSGRPGANRLSRHHRGMAGPEYRDCHRAVVPS